MKNIIIILLIFIVPLVAYKLLSGRHTDTGAEVGTTNRPQIIKFSALMCAECKELDAVLDEVYPKYEKKIDLIKIQVQDNDSKTKELIKKYGITLTPTMILLDSQGEKLDKIEGSMEKDKLDKLMKDLSEDEYVKQEPMGVK